MSHCAQSVAATHEQVKRAPRRVKIAFWLDVTLNFPPGAGRRAVKLVRVSSRLALLSAAAAVFVGLTGFYGGSVRSPLPDSRYRLVNRQRPSAPQIGRFLEFLGAGLELAVFAVGGRIVLRLRLSPASSSEGQPILLGVHQQTPDDEI
jgi:hypothetical protein